MESRRNGFYTLVFFDDVLWYKILINKMSLLTIEDDLQQVKVNGTQDVHILDATDNVDTKSAPRTNDPSDKTQISAPICQFKMDGYVLSTFVNLLRSSPLYRKLVISNLSQQCRKSKTDNSTQLCIQLVAPRHEMFDLNWNQRVEWMLMERRELDSAMSWFSTFGGAFSALGEEFQHCAEMAGKISLQQMRLALRLGDPLTVSRCRLYWALSCIQRGQLVTARAIIVSQLALARAHQDERLERMCFGIYARLKYEHRCRRLAKQQDLSLQQKHHLCST